MEQAPRRRLRRQVVGLDGQLDVQHLGVGAQHLPRHVDFDEHQLVIDDLRGDGRSLFIAFSFFYFCNVFRRDGSAARTDWVASSSIPIFIRLASKYSLRLCKRSPEITELVDFLFLHSQIQFLVLNAAWVQDVERSLSELLFLAP